MVYRLNSDAIDARTPASADLSRLNMLFLFADEAPNLVEFQILTRQIAHDSTKNRAASLTDSNTKTHDRIAMDANHTLDCPNAGAFC